VYGVPQEIANVSGTFEPGRFLPEKLAVQRGDRQVKLPDAIITMRSVIRMERSHDE
jgi:hypothetical protein